jgi:glycolate oxidase
MDLKRMDQIIKIDRDCYASLSGVSHAHSQLHSSIKSTVEGYEFIKGLTLVGSSPASASVLAMAINHGIGHLNGRIGINSQLLTGMEVVLPTGEVCKLGSCAYSDSWHSYLPLPRMDGLFTGWLGTTGIVTKLGMWIFPIRPFKDVCTIAAASAEDITKYMVHWRHYSLCDEVTAVSWWLAQVPIVFPYREKPKDAPEFYSYTVITGWTQEEIDYKKKMWKQVVAQERAKGTKLIDFEYPQRRRRVGRNFRAGS